MHLRTGTCRQRGKSPGIAFSTPVNEGKARGMPATKEQQRTELHKTIWSIADDLRGSVDGWDFKQYILGTLFYRFISENLCTYLAEQEGDPSFDYSKLSDEQAEYGRVTTVEEEHFSKFVPNDEVLANDANLSRTSIARPMTWWQMPVGLLRRAGDLPMRWRTRRWYGATGRSADVSLRRSWAEQSEPITARQRWQSCPRR